MGQEIERKFLVHGDAWRLGMEGTFCQQGYLVSNNDCTVRVRVMGEKGFLTIKGRIEGIQRSEYEYSIPVQEAREMLAHLCAPPVIEKCRYHREFAGQI
jgi:CYTH domain-containing protein